MSKIWAKNYELNELIEEFTVGSDYLLDQELIVSDCLASTAHAVMLTKAGILTNEELVSLKKGIREILEIHSRGEFPILRSDEDGHTAIENYLTAHIGEAGKKIHTGRSRNDQVITALRLFSRTFLLDYMKRLGALAGRLLSLADEHKETPMPGRTHMQIAMPSSVGLWLSAWAEELIDQLRLAMGIFAIVDQNPLGSAASYGVPLPLDRQMTADLMGFARVQNNVLYVNNSRGRMESMILDLLDQTGLTLSKMAQDLILFSLPEFGYFSLPMDLCSGSSIMPQKKNPDGLELLRAKSGTLSAYATQVKNIIRSLPSGYNRDFQETKEPFLKGCRLILISLGIMDLTIEKMSVNKENLAKGFTSDIYATDYALELVAGGASFRDAYREVGLNLDALESRDPVESLKTRTYPGTTGNLNLSPAENALKSLEGERAAIEERINGSFEELLG
ncbi:MAG: argininosuccinate lyase [Spirochaetales bacterium]|nr:argininosuccinate lyase [Spirochaetales bacterium]